MLSMLEYNPLNLSLYYKQRRQQIIWILKSAQQNLFRKGKINFFSDFKYSNKFLSSIGKVKLIETSFELIRDINVKN